MDIFTHALLPYFAGSLLNLNRRALVALVLGGIVPDLDFLILWINYIYPTNFLLVHRGLSHSLFFGFLSALVFLLITSQDRVRGTIQRFTGIDPSLTWTALAFAYVGVLSHLFLDYMTTRGVPLLYPFDASRRSADVFYSTEITVAIASLAIVIMLLRKRSCRTTMTRLFAAFLIVIVVVGAVRIEGKDMSSDLLDDGAAKSYPAAGLFKWSILKDDGSRFNVYEFDLLSGNAGSKTAFPHLVVYNGAGSLSNISTALRAADTLPQIDIFRWRAYAVAINASFKDDVWYLEYYDPIVRMEQMHSPSMIRIAAGSYSSVKIKVDGKKATVIE